MLLPAGAACRQVRGRGHAHRQPLEREEAGGHDGARLAHLQVGLTHPCLCAWHASAWHAVVRADPRHGMASLAEQKERHVAAWELRASLYVALALGWSMQFILSSAAAWPSTSPRQAHCCCSTGHRLTKVSIASLVGPHTGRTSTSPTRAWCRRVRCRCATGTRPSCPSRSERWVRVASWDEPGCPDGIGLNGGWRQPAPQDLVHSCRLPQVWRLHPALIRAGCKKPSPATQPACF